MSVTVTPDAILKQLAELWVTLGKPAEGGAGVLRACAMTLISVCDQDDDFQALGETVAALMPDYPARSILVRLGFGEPAGMEARVYSQCWMPFGQRRQICCEQVEIHASAEELEDLAPLLLPLCAPDLPVIVWAKSGRAALLPAFAPVAALASKAIVDSATMGSPRQSLEWLGAAAARGILPGDLAWTRLSRWREMLARLFDNRETLARLPEIRRVRVVCAPPAPSSAAFYMGAWLAASLRRAGVEAETVFDSDPAAPAGEIARITLSGAEGGFAIGLDAHGDVLTASAAGVSSCVMLPHPADHLLLREEIAIQREDPIFNEALPTAWAFAVSSGVK
jgi:glucose-6-phosphate dehydrogenase assembly protein OpcA